MEDDSPSLSDRRNIQLSIPTLDSSSSSLCEDDSSSQQSQISDVETEHPSDMLAISQHDSILAELDVDLDGDEEDEEDDDDDEGQDGDSKGGSIIKRSWTPEEDQLLIKLVRKYGPRRWSVIASYLDGRVGKQCRERWHNHLSPDVKKDSWTEEEDRIIMDSVAKMGTKWSKIVKLLPGRTDNAIKNRWNSTMRKNIRRAQKSADQAAGGCVPSAPPKKPVSRVSPQKTTTKAPAANNRSRKRNNDDLDTSVLSHLTSNRKVVQLAKEIAASEHFSDADKRCLLADLLLGELQKESGRPQPPMMDELTSPHRDDGSDFDCDVVKDEKQKEDDTEFLSLCSPTTQDMMAVKRMRVEQDKDHEAGAEAPELDNHEQLDGDLPDLFPNDWLSQYSQQQKGCFAMPSPLKSPLLTPNSLSNIVDVC